MHGHRIERHHEAGSNHIGASAIPRQSERAGCVNTLPPLTKSHTPERIVQMASRTLPPGSDCAARALAQRRDAVRGIDNIESNGTDVQRGMAQPEGDLT